MEAVSQAPAVAQPGSASRLVLFVTVFIDLLGFGIVIPFLPLFAERQGVGAVGVGVVLAVYSLMQFVFAPILGRISDRIGRRPIIMLGLLGSALGYLIYGVAFSFWMLLLSRAVHGACAATISTAQAYVADTTSESERAGGMGLIGAAFGLGFVIGPALGGLLGHGSLRTPAFFASGLSLVNLLLAAVYLPESLRGKDAAAGTVGAAQSLAALLKGLGERRLWRLFSLAFLFTFAFAALETTFSLMVPVVYGYGPAGVGGLLAFAGLVQAVTQGYVLRKIVDRTGERRLVAIGALAMGVGMTPLASFSSRALLFGLLAMVAAGYGLSSPSIASLISKSTTLQKQGEVLGINQSALSLARILGPIGGGMLYQLLGPAGPYLSAAFIMAAVLALVRGLGTDT